MSSKSLKQKNQIKSYIDHQEKPEGLIKGVVLKKHKEKTQKFLVENKKSHEKIDKMLEEKKKKLVQKRQDILNHALLSHGFVMNSSAKSTSSQSAMKSAKSVKSVKSVKSDKSEARPISSSSNMSQNHSMVSSAKSNNGEDSPNFSRNFVPMMRKESPKLKDKKDAKKDPKKFNLDKDHDDLPGFR